MLRTLQLMKPVTKVLTVSVQRAMWLVALLLCPVLSHASTEAGEMVIVTVNGDKVVVKIMYMEYFSTSPTPNFVPGTTMNLASRGKIESGYTVFALDGRLVSDAVGRQALKSGTNVFIYNKGSFEFMKGLDKFRGIQMM